jgi:hypothetical protein
MVCCDRSMTLPWKISAGKRTQMFETAAFVLVGALCAGHVDRPECQLTCDLLDLAPLLRLTPHLQTPQRHRSAQLCAKPQAFVSCGQMLSLPHTLTALDSWAGYHPGPHLHDHELPCNKRHLGEVHHPADNGQGLHLQSCDGFSSWRLSECLKRCAWILFMM